MAKPTTIDAYLATVRGDQRLALDRLRSTIHAILPDVEECISYSMPAFRVTGHVVAGFLATAKGCSFYPFSGTTLATLADDLGGYDKERAPLRSRKPASQGARAPAARDANRRGERRLTRPRGAYSVEDSLGNLLDRDHRGRPLRADVLLVDVLSWDPKRRRARIDDAVR